MSSGRESWLTDQGDIETEVAARMAQVDRKMASKEAEELRRAVHSRAGAWQKPSIIVDAPRLHLLKPVCLEEVLGKLGKQADLLAQSAASTSGGAAGAKANSKANW